MPTFHVSTSAAEALRFQEDAYLRLEQPARYRDTFRRLQATLGKFDHMLIGYDEIEDFLWCSGVRNREGNRVDEQTVRRWRRELNFPLLRGHGALPGRHRATSPYTTTFAIVAWLTSLPYSGGFRFPRIERTPKARSGERSSRPRARVS